MADLWLRIRLPRQGTDSIPGRGTKNHTCHVSHNPGSLSAATKTQHSQKNLKIIHKKWVL